MDEPSPAKGVLVTAHKYFDVVTNQFIGNTQIDAVSRPLRSGTWRGFYAVVLLHFWHIGNVVRERNKYSYAHQSDNYELRRWTLSCAS